MYQQTFVTTLALKQAKDQREIEEEAVIGAKLGAELLRSKRSLDTGIKILESLATYLKEFRNSSPNVNEPLQLEMQKQLTEVHTTFTSLRDRLVPIIGKISDAKVRKSWITSPGA